MQQRFVCLWALATLTLTGWAWADDPGTPDKTPGMTDVAPLVWLEFGEALDKAAAEDKHIINDFYTDWCGWCKVMDRKTYADPRVMKLLHEAFAISKINAESGKRFRVGDREMTGKELAREYRVQSFPMTWFLKPDGSQLANVPGYIEANKFVRALEYVQARNYENQSE
jgi:thioredoxin-related protein